MPLLIILGILAYWGIRTFADWATTNVVPFSSSELKSMRKEMSGKSQAQCSKVIDKYSNGKKRWQNLG